MRVQFTRPDIITHNPALELSQRLVTRPSSTFLISLKGRSSEWAVLVVDRAAQPRDGAMVLLGTRRGFRVARWHDDDSLENLWGIVTWVVRRP
ncbi:MAG: molybdenum ABC transporter permease [Pyramidobacter sp.]|nr:molybdenum ABC transporter permease [Pyramidobacter sp.]